MVLNVSDTLVLNGVEWDKNEVIRLIGRQEVKRLLFDTIEKLPLKNETIYFNDDIWKFETQSQVNQSKGVYMYDFNVFPFYIKPYVKKLVLNYIFVRKLRFQTLKHKFLEIKKFQVFLNQHSVMDLRYLTPSILEGFIQHTERRVGERTKEKIFSAIKDLFKEYEKYNDISMSDLYYLLDNNLDKRLIKAETIESKTPLIPNHIFNAIINTAFEEVTDESNPAEYRVEAGMVLLLSQIGMRLGELTLLEADKKHTVSILDETESISYLEFKTYKTVKGDRFKWAQSFLTEQAEIAYDIVCELTRTAREEHGSNYLFNSYFGRNKPINKHFHPATIYQKIYRFVIRNKERIPCINLSEEESKGFNRKKVSVARKNYTEGTSDFQNLVDLNDEDYICVPNAHQYRVTVCTKLYEQGVNIDWIREHMNHISMDMTLHYIREQEQEQQRFQQIRETIRHFMEEENNDDSNDLKPLYKQIDRFINRNNFRTNVDVESIIEDLNGNAPLREKEQGYCTKTNFGRSCPKNEEVDIPEFNPNHLVHFEFVDITYNRYLKIKDVICYNRDNNFKVEVEREEKRLGRLIENYLLPELNELEKEMSNREVKELTEEYPHLEEIISNFEDIYKEVERWNI